MHGVPLPAGSRAQPAGRTRVPTVCHNQHSAGPAHWDWFPCHTVNDWWAWCIIPALIQNSTCMFLCASPPGNCSNQQVAKDAAPVCTPAKYRVSVYTVAMAAGLCCDAASSSPCCNSQCEAPELSWQPVCVYGYGHAQHILTPGIATPRACRCGQILAAAGNRRDRSDALLRVGRPSVRDCLRPLVACRGQQQLAVCSYGWSHGSSTACTCFWVVWATGSRRSSSIKCLSTDSG